MLGTLISPISWLLLFSLSAPIHYNRELRHFLTLVSNSTNKWKTKSVIILDSVTSYKTVDVTDPRLIALDVFSSTTME